MPKSVLAVGARVPFRTTLLQMRGCGLLAGYSCPEQFGVLRALLPCNQLLPECNTHAQTSTFTMLQLRGRCLAGKKLWNLPCSPCSVHDATCAQSSSRTEPSTLVMLIAASHLTSRSQAAQCSIFSMFSSFSVGGAVLADGCEVPCRSIT